MTPTVEEIVKGLSEAQRTALLRMKVRKPHPAMPNYWAVEFYGGDLPAGEIDGLVKQRLVALPISTGGRGSPTYHGEIHSLGRSVRTYLESMGDGNG